MADELRLVLIIIGALVLGGLFIHGLWTVRKNNRQTNHRYHPDDATPPAAAEQSEGFDDLGVGPVRVIKSRSGAPTAAETARTEPKINPVPTKPAAQDKHNSDSQGGSRQQPEFDFDGAGEKTEPAITFSALADDEKPRRSVPDNTTRQVDDRVDTETASEQKSAHQPSEVLILYVLLPEGRDIKGPDLLSALLPLGFKYGDMDIFHRHLDSAGGGDVLFSLANMFNPGTFDLEQIDKISTRGLSLFMTLPGPGEPLQNFNLMHNAAKKLAEEFGGQVLDGQRSVLTVQTVRHYVDKIREFQRQQLIHG
ncbi:MAG: cell division protein ZipA [Rheinheimera sp.]|uniref:cell division protein ZipA n=1 Tax=Arsukibacterium sp. UBA3155 TaxID=1946058 RepID=UPI000C95B17A|nr:cell division protein ZipA [Arsukibacterium sp. UBA3155]MAD76162.1 cell division protein ZipA [Rheinheimera sp.]|tara:strand:+ start:100798 stop:101724 length:927 start_codon:yes stop_codon:yes gene_type:complete